MGTPEEKPFSFQLRDSHIDNRPFTACNNGPTRQRNDNRGEYVLPPIEMEADFGADAANGGFVRSLPFDGGGWLLLRRRSAPPLLVQHGRTALLTDPQTLQRVLSALC